MLPITTYRAIRNDLNAYGEHTNRRGLNGQLLALGYRRQMTGQENIGAPGGLAKKMTADFHDFQGIGALCYASGANIHPVTGASLKGLGLPPTHR